MRFANTARKADAKTPSRASFHSAKKPSSETLFGKLRRNSQALLFLAVLSAVSLMHRRALSNENHPRKIKECSAPSNMQSESNFSTFLKNCRSSVGWKKILGNARVSVIGYGTHSESFPKLHISKNMGLFKQEGITHIALEAFQESMQKAVDEYLATGKGMGKLKRYIEENFTHPEVADSILAILDSAREHGIKIVCIHPDFIEKNGEPFVPDFDSREISMAGKISEILNKKDSRVMVMVGAMHIQPGLLPSKIGQTLDGGNLVTVQLIGSEQEPYIYLEGEPFKFERTIRENGFATATFMFGVPPSNSGIGDFFIHLPQVEPFQN